jgi:hypothetical protein
MAEDLAYAAGVIDTLGLLRVRTTDTGSELPSVTISTANGDLLKFLADSTGTNPFVVRRAYDKHRCLEHCEAPHEHIESVTSRWNITGVRATVMLNGITEYMRMQQDEARHLLAVGLGAPFKAATLQRMVSLGWPLPEEWQS